MRYKIIVGLAALLLSWTQTNDCSPKKNTEANNRSPKEDIKMNNQPLVIKVKCRGNEQCLFEGKDIFLDIDVYNDGKTEVGFPLEYMREKSPIIKLIDTRTKEETFLPTHIADHDLKEKFTTIKPNESVSIEWVITAQELRQFGSDVDLSAEFTIMVEILVNGKKVEFRGSDTRHIVSKK
jgi:hypothetical protein